MNIDFKKILQQGCKITSSGTTGPPKTIYRDPKNLKYCIKAAIDGQNITSDSKIYTCTRMTHAGGLLLQSLPAYTLGCDIKIEKFNAYNFLSLFNDYTHTFLPPAMCEAVINTKGFKKCNLENKFITMGSDAIPDRHIKAFIDKGATVFTNWGMSEIGPWVINKKYTPGSEVDHSVLGDTFWCNWKIVNNELYVKSNMCIYPNWFATGDIVREHNGVLYYDGRK